MRSRAVALLTIGAALAPGAAFAADTLARVDAERATVAAATKAEARRSSAGTWHLREPHCYRAAATLYKCRISEDQDLDKGGLVCRSKYDVRKKLRAPAPTARRTSFACYVAPNARP